MTFLAASTLTLPTPPHRDTCSGLAITRDSRNAELRNKIYQYAIDIDDKKWFLGMPKSRKWMLYAQQLDPLGLHNWLGFEVARATGQYAPRTQFCEV